ncbi:alpha/beta superfamily hydrolase like protein [Zymoseptoria brevis]|uniref:Alpha/beta superfamily hydrolase like protein n=1 Tax=Zymoseptoria brevis TaxID=1047168 RepID=A0A0F4G9U8_9PEZI|nr:alpha/beta superfamily hydrolase like protein [Zymoseptoria brevis]
MYLCRSVSSRRAHESCARLKWSASNSRWVQHPRARRANFHSTSRHRDDSGRVSSLLADTLPSFLVPPVVFTGLLLALWTYKAFMTVIGQNKIIYMPYMPPFTRSEEMADYTNLCKPVEWRHEKMRSLDGTKLSICVGEIPPADQGQVAIAKKKKNARHVVIVHFHGNGGSLPPRLPLLSNFFKAIQQQVDTAGTEVKFTMVALSPRGYWKSSGRASQKGIEQDAQALLRWIPNHLLSDGNSGLEFILWGQSLGAGVATSAAATYLAESHNTATMPPILGLLLETPFTSIKSMLLTLCPQKWLPYRYLHPFLWNHWDSRQALATIGQHFSSRNKASEALKVLLMIAEKDEVVPAEESKKLEEACEQAGLDWQRKDAAGALHVDALAKSQGRDQATRWIVNVVEAKRE